MMFHKHKFIKKGNVLYCECGVFKVIPCSHKLKRVSERIVERFGNRQTLETYQCKICGKIQIINQTTGQIEKSIDTN